MKSFKIELRDLYKDWAEVTVFYDCGEFCAQPMKDEFGIEWGMSQLTPYDQNRVKEALIFELSADEMGNNGEPIQPEDCDTDITEENQN